MLDFADINFSMNNAQAKTFQCIKNVFPLRRSDLALPVRINHVNQLKSYSYDV